LAEIIVSFIEAFLFFMYLILGRLIHGKHYNGQEQVPTHIKAIAGVLVYAMIAVVILVIFKINN
jgi:hypothetical protein